MRISIKKEFKMQSTNKIPFAVLLLFLLAGTAVAQDITIAGTITDRSTGESIPGSNVLIKGTETGVVSDMEGNYSILVPHGESILIFSFIGYKTREIHVGNRNQIDVELDADLQSLEE